MIIKPTSLEDFLSSKINSLPGRDDTKAYMVSALSKYKHAEFDLSKRALTLEYASAKSTGDFSKYQNIADWILFTNIFYPESLNGASENYYITLGQSSYYKCFLIIRKEWLLFEEMSDMLPEYIKQMRVEILGI